MRRGLELLALTLALIFMTLPATLALFFHPARWADKTLIAASDLLMAFQERAEGG